MNEKQRAVTWIRSTQVVAWHCLLGTPYMYLQYLSAGKHHGKQGGKQGGKHGGKHGDKHGTRHTAHGPPWKKTKDEWERKVRSLLMRRAAVLYGGPSLDPRTSKAYQVASAPPHMILKVFS